ncbi:MAG: hypothetical protein ACO26U_00125 [Burkholderiaceae bacterium]
MRLIARTLTLALLLALAACAPLAPPGSRPTPLPDRPIDISGRCNQTEEDGFHEQARLDVRGNRVQALSWRIDIGRKGHCHFELGDFRQVQARPSIELLERSGGACKLMVWQGQGRVTLAHAGCERFCSGGIYEQAWPVMFDAATGACASVR